MSLPRFPRAFSVPGPFLPWANVCYRFPEGQVAYDQGLHYWTVYVREDGSSRFRMVGVVPAAHARRRDLQAGEGYAMDWMNAYREGAVQSAMGKGATDEKFAKSYPHLFDLMTVTLWKPDEVRQPSTLLVFTEDGLWKLCLNERDLQYTLWSTGQTFTEALQTMEKRLQAPTIEWRKARPQGQRRKN